ncbi:MAG: prolipoprotein diacylglyceryl transferase [Planctomycetota bacterium]
MWPELIPKTSLPDWLPFFPKTFGVTIMLGTCMALWLAAKRGERFGFSKDQVWDFGVTMVLAGIVGARLFDVMENWSEHYWEPYSKGFISFGKLLLKIVAVWEGGLTYYGGFIVAAVIGIWIIIRKGIPLGLFVDLMIPSLALGHAFGRVACFLEGCCFGIPTLLPWGVSYGEGSHLHQRCPHYPIDITVHPTQLYEALGLFLIAWVLGAFLMSNKWRGRLLWLYLLSYGLLRFVVEFWRGDNKKYEWFGFDLHFSQYIALATFVVGIIGFVMTRPLNKS